LIGIVQLSVTCMVIRYSYLSSASSLTNALFVIVTLRNWRLKFLMALVESITLRIGSGY